MELACNSASGRTNDNTPFEQSEIELSPTHPAVGQGGNAFTTNLKATYMSMGTYG